MNQSERSLGETSIDNFLSHDLRNNNEVNEQKFEFIV